MSLRHANDVTRYTPLFAFLAVYVATCLTGALLLLSRWDPFLSLFVYFTGTRPPDLDRPQLVVALTLLFAPPLLLAAGYAFGLVVSLGRGHRGSRRREVTQKPWALGTPSWVPHAVFYVVATRAAIEIGRAGVVLDISSWLNYSEWIEARASTFEQITFFGFVNVYMFLPLATAWAFLTPWGRRLGIVLPDGRSFSLPLARWAPPVITGILSLLLFQKKTIVVSILIIVIAWLAHSQRQRLQLRRIGAALLAAVAMGYFALVIVPVYRQASGYAPVSGGQYVPAVVAYAALAPLTRTAGPSIYYPVVFPDEHPYYGLDLGQDVLGVGDAPDDNRVIWDRMNRGVEGSVATPFQFALYSQVGLLPTLALSVLIGFLVALAWRMAHDPRWPRLWSALLSSLVTLLGIYLAIESPRNSILVSYGVAWGFLFVLGAALAITMTRRLLHADTYATPERLRSSHLPPASETSWDVRDSRS